MKLGQLVAAVATVVVSVPLQPRDIPDYPGLSFADGKFEITVFNDLHLGDRGVQDYKYQKTIDDDNHSIELMGKILDMEKDTQLAIVNGDLLAGDWVAEKDSYPLLDRVMSPFLSRKMHFATTFGNHDWSATCNTQTMSDYIWNTANTHTPGITFTTSSVAGDRDQVGTSNYYIPLYSTSNGKKVLKMILWFFDSKGGYKFTGNGDPNTRQPVYGYVHPDVVNWFKQTLSTLETQHGGKTIPSLVFVHIPIPITQQFIQKPFLEPGISLEQVAAQEADKSTAFSQMLADTKGLLGVFSGHDHKMDWCKKWNRAPAPDTHVCFCRHTGYGGYAGDVLRGGRHIVIYENALDLQPIDNAIKTWTRLETGAKSGEVMLNSTYGRDEYPGVYV